MTEERKIEIRNLISCLEYDIMLFEYQLFDKYFVDEYHRDMKTFNQYFLKIFDFRMFNEEKIKKIKEELSGLTENEKIEYNDLIKDFGNFLIKFNQIVLRFEIFYNHLKK